MIYFEEVKNNNLIRELSKICIKIFKENPFSDDENLNNIVINKNYTPSALKYLKLNNRNYYLVMSNLSTVGYFSYEIHGNKLYISEIYLLNKKQKQGIGRKVVEFLFEIIKDSYYCEVNKQNNNAIEFFKHLKFNESGYCNENILNKNIEYVILNHSNG